MNGALARLAASARWMSALGVMAAAVLMVSSNVISHRFNERWDVTGARTYTLSPATIETLESLDSPIDVVVFLSESDPLTSSVRFMLEAYVAETHWLRPRFVDPDREPAEFVALQNKYGLFEGAAENGRLKSGASIVIANERSHWFVTPSDIVAYDEDAGRSRPKLEQALTEGIHNVVYKRETQVCFGTGHQELSIDTGGTQGLAELKASLERNNYTARTVDLGGIPPAEALANCEVVIVAGPRLPFSTEQAARLLDHFDRGGSLLLSLDPIWDTDGQIEPSGLEPVLARAGVELGRDVVVESTPSLVVPTGIGGEVFFATPKPHDVTRGLVSAANVKFRVMVQMAQSLRATEGSVATPLLVSSAEARSVTDVRAFAEGGRAREALARSPSAERTIATASEIASAPADGRGHGARLVLIGASTPLWGDGFRQAALYGNRLFVESAVSWLAAAPLLVSVPEKPTNEVSLNLTEASLNEVQRYVLVYMPGTALLLGVLVLLRRRKAEREARGSGADAEGAS